MRRVLLLAALVGAVLAVILLHQLDRLTGGRPREAAPFASTIATAIGEGIPNLPGRRVAVTPLDKDGHGTLREELIAQLSTRTTLVERERLDLLVREQRFQSSPLVDPRTAVRLGRLVGADTVVHGRVRRWIDIPGLVRLDATFSIIDVERGEVVYSKTFSRARTSPVAYAVLALLALAFVLLTLEAIETHRERRAPIEAYHLGQEIHEEAVHLAGGAVRRARAIEDQCDGLSAARQEARELVRGLERLRDGLRTQPLGDPQRQPPARVNLRSRTNDGARRTLHAILAELDDLGAQRSPAFEQEAASTLRKLRHAVVRSHGEIEGVPTTLG